jgi:hypothetical protein
VINVFDISCEAVFGWRTCRTWFTNVFTASSSYADRSAAYLSLDGLSATSAGYPYLHHKRAVLRHTAASDLPCSPRLHHSPRWINSEQHLLKILEGNVSIAPHPPTPTAASSPGCAPASTHRYENGRLLCVSASCFSTWQCAGGAGISISAQQPGVVQRRQAVSRSGMEKGRHYS